MRNSLLIAQMPTASTAQIAGAIGECMEPLFSNWFKRQTLSGESAVINPYLVADLMEIGEYDAAMISDIMAANGSVQGIARIPDRIKAVYKTVWEIPLRKQLEYAADRG